MDQHVLITQAIVKYLLIINHKNAKEIIVVVEKKMTSIS